MPSSKRMWTFLVEGGEPFEVTMGGHPPLQHDGRRTVWKAYVPLEDLLAVETGIKEAVGDTGRVTKFVEFDMPAKEADPQELISEHGKVISLRHPECPTCSWFSPMTPTNCGLTDWVHEMICSHLNFPKAKADFDNCPDKKAEDA